MSSKVRQLSKEEILPEDLNIAAVTINRTIEFYSAPEFYGKARAYFFTNFVIITFGLLICTVRSFLFEDIETTLGFIIMTLYRHLFPIFYGVRYLKRRTLKNID